MSHYLVSELVLILGWCEVCGKFALQRIGEEGFGSCELKETAGCWTAGRDTEQTVLQRPAETITLRMCDYSELAVTLRSRAASHPRSPRGSPRPPLIKEHICTVVATQWEPQKPPFNRLWRLCRSKQILAASRFLCLTSFISWQQKDHLQLTYASKMSPTPHRGGKVV